MGGGGGGGTEDGSKSLDMTKGTVGRECCTVLVTKRREW